MNERVLLIEDDDAMRTSLTQTLELEDMTVLQANGLAQARRAIRANFAGVVLSDIRMPREDGFDVLARVRDVDPDLPVILLTGEADVPMAVRALRNGAYDFLEKPCTTDDLLKSLRRALDHRRVVLQARRLEQKLESSDVAAINFPGSTQASTRLRAELRRTADLSVAVHFHGAPGAGKRLAAFTLHILSGNETTSAINLEDADCAKQIAALQMSAGTLILKNIEAMTDPAADTLTTCLAALPDGVRVLTTAKLPLAALPAAIRTVFTPANPVEIDVPGLAARAADLPVIFEALVRQAARDLNTNMPVTGQPILAALKDRNWSGNLPELRSFARKYVVGGTDGEAESPGLSEQIEAFEKQVLIETLRRHNGKAALAAEDLKLARKTLYDRMARHGIKPRDLKSAE